MWGPPENLFATQVWSMSRTRGVQNAGSQKHNTKKTEKLEIQMANHNATVTRNRGEVPVGIYNFSYTAKQPRSIYNL